MSSSVQVGPKLRTLDEKVRMASTAMFTSTRALLDEIMDMGGRRQRRCPPLFQWP